jgi:hypothetical protein
MINREHFFDRIRQSLFFGKMNTDQVNGLNAILDEWDAHYAHADQRFLAYLLATVHHETGRHMQPIEEFNKGKNKDYGQKLKMGGGPGKRVLYDMPDQLYYGRGFVQLTWYENYERAAKELHIDCLHHPAMVMQLDIAIKILFVGMMKGWFTGKKLANYFNPTTQDWMNARKIINGTDKAQLIASYALAYYAAIVRRG